VKAALVTKEENLIAISQKAQILKAPLESIPILKRSTQGVRIMKLEENDQIASFSLF